MPKPQRESPSFFLLVLVRNVTNALPLTRGSRNSHFSICLIPSGSLQDRGRPSTLL